MDGTLLDLNDATAFPANTDWHALVEAKDINESGAIVGQGVLNRASNGRSCSRPNGSLASRSRRRWSRQSGDNRPYHEPRFTPLEAFVWSPADKQLFAVQPAPRP